MLRSLQLGKPKTPGFGISKDFYLSVLSSKSVLPTMLEVINPAGTDRAVEGFGAPLMPNADKAALSLPLERGLYALATKDRKTVLTMRILSKEEAGFDPSVFVRSVLSVGASSELSNRMLATWQLIQLTFESHDPMVYAAGHFLLELVQRLAYLCEGVVADPIAGRYLLPTEVFHVPRADARIDARDFIAIRSRLVPSGLHVYTAGMRKFNLPELEIDGIEDGLLTTTQTLLYSLCQARLLSQSIEPGMKVGAKKVPFQIAEGGLDKSVWEGIPAFELLPPTGVTASQAMQAWSEEKK